MLYKLEFQSISYLYIRKLFQLFPSNLPQITNFLILISGIVKQFEFALRLLFLLLFLHFYLLYLLLSRLFLLLFYVLLGLLEKFISFLFEVPHWQLLIVLFKAYLLGFFILHLFEYLFGMLLPHEVFLHAFS